MAVSIGMRSQAGLSKADLGDTLDVSRRLRAFAVARRHSRLVKALRLALPAAAALFALFYAFVVTTSWKLGQGRLNVGQVQITKDDLTMKNPSYFGVTKDGNRYEVRAKKAVVEFNNQAPIKLFDIDGDLVQPNNVVTKMKSNEGLLDNAKNELELWGDVQVDATNGMSARLQRATIYQKENRVVSKHPVKAIMPTGTVEGAAMAMKTDTHQATFFGDVKVHLIESASAQGGVALGRDARQPVDVTADQLSVDDRAKTALFSGKVAATQGDTTLRAPELLVSYEGKAATDLMGAAQTQPSGGSSQLSRLVAINGVVVTAGSDRRITSKQADFDAKADTALFTGDVVVTQIKNVMRGQRLYVERKSGKSRLESPGEIGQPIGQIAAIFYQSENKTAPAKAKPATPNPTAAAAEGMLGSFRTDPSAPIDIEADSVDVYDTQKQAVFHGNVKSQQGDFVVRTVEMIAFYSGQGNLGMAAGGDAAGKAQTQLTRVEARQKVLVTSIKDGQTATGDWAIFDVKANTVLMGDRVVVTRGKDVAEGPRLKIDLNTGMYRFEVEAERTAAVPATSSLPATATAPNPVTPGAVSPTGKGCPPGKQCLLFYPKDAQDRASDLAKKIAPGVQVPKSGGGGQPGISASPVQRSD